jgi:hypothetical protein
MIPLHSAESAARSPWAALAGAATIAIASTKISDDFNLYPLFACFTDASSHRPNSHPAARLFLMQTRNSHGSTYLPSHIPRPAYSASRCAVSCPNKSPDHATPNNIENNSAPKGQPTRISARIAPVMGGQIEADFAHLGSPRDQSAADNPVTSRACAPRGINPSPIARRLRRAI